MRFPGRLLALAAPLWLFAGLPAQADEPRYRLEPRDCWFDSSQVSGADCAVLFVPERWSRSPGAKPAKEFRLRVTRFRADRSGQDLPPVFYLSAGPGYSAIPEGVGRAQVWRRFADRLETGRDIVLFDQRGTGRAYPRLGCPKAVKPKVWAGLSESKADAGRGTLLQREALEDCLDRYRELGRDLGAFTSRESAADVDALRAALGYDRILLFGQSYGTSLALTILTRFPDIVSAAVLDSVLPPQVASGRINPRSFGTALQRLFDACESHGSCGEAYPDLRSKLARTLARLYVEPVLLEVQNLQGIEPLYAKIDDVALLNIIFFEMHERPGLQTLPMMIAGFAKGEHWRLRSHAENYYYNTYLPQLAVGMFLSVDCHEQFALSSRRDQRAAAAEAPFLLNWGTTLWQESACHFWPVEPAASIDRNPVVSDIPTLLLAGAFDPMAPVELAELAAESLVNSHLFVIPNGGHTVASDGGCAQDILDAFLDDPTRRPDPNCLKDQPPPAFTVLGGN